ncbi:hypothetical protein EMPS_05465 [Entomortierella parvispora]|uniref:Protein kinase domain-containing protein n=1 Tax=Entomortierella parvispora TaxID=205924 RepID=A0A9P3HAI4_9FUNG|nr:hypothetical protein EMPS_05465 [Entomortierella parvispora]
MTFSIPQPIPSRSSHPVHAHQRPPIRRSQSHTIATVAATLADSPSTVGGSGANPKFGITHLLASALHPDIGEDLTLGNDDDLDDHCDHDEDDDDESSEPLVERRFDSGHYSSMEEENRGIPIGKPSFLYKSNPVSAFSNRSSNSHLYGTYGSGSVDASAQLSGGPGHPSRRHVYSHSHSNSDGHNSMNVMANNLKGTHSNKSKNQANGGQDATDCINGNLSTNSLGLRATVDHTRNELQPQIPHVEYQPQPPSPQQQMALTEQASTAAVPSLFTPFADAPSSSRSIAIPQQANRQEGAQSVARPTSNGPPTPAPGPTQHPHPIISIDTSKARLIKTPVSAPKDTMATKEAGSAVAVKRAVSISALPRSRAEGQLTLGLRKEEKASTPGATVTAPTSSSTANNSSTRPLMMASQSRLSSALPPTPSYHQRQHSLTAQESVLLPALSPSSPRANSALVTSLEQLSVSWKAPEHTPSFPINRLHRSRTISSGTRPSINSSFSSNGTFGSSNNSGNQYQFQQSNLVSPSTMVTSSSYSSLPYSPAVAFLSNFVDATAPQMAPDEEGEQVGDFIMGKVIGHGGFSIVREAFAIHLDGMVAQVAVKIVKTQTGLTDNDRVQRMLDKEVAIWSRLAHPNVLPFVAVEKLPCSTFVFCELCTGGHLLDYITKQEASSYLSPRAGSSTIGLGETQARLIFNQIAEAVRYLHEEKRIVHRDIKLENILQHEDGTWKICDFGLAEYQNDEAASYFGSPVSPTIYNPRASQSKGLQGSPTSARSDSSLPDDSNADIMAEDDDDIVGGSLAYCSPEQLRSQKPLRCPSSDVWSLGVVLYALLTGRLPFQDEYEPRLQYQILNGRYEDPTECSVEARELLRNMFRSKPEDRWRIGQVMDSPWCMGTMQESCFDDYNNGSTKLNNNFFASFRM